MPLTQVQGQMLSGSNNTTTTIQSNGTTAITIDASQNVGIGTSSPSSKLHVAGTGFVSDTFQVSGTPTTVNSNGIGLEFRGSSTPSIIAYSRVGSAYLPMTNSASVHIWDTNGTERMRIDSSGNLLVGTTSPTDNSRLAVSQTGDRNCITALTTSTGGSAVIRVQTSHTSMTTMYFLTSTGTVAGSITSSGSSTAFNTSSDYRLKENIAPMAGALAKIAQLKPVTYNWKSDGSAGQGFIAHELQAVVPDCVTGEKDAVDEDGSIKPQGIDTSFLVATLTAAIQEQQAMIEELKVEVQALKAK